MNDSAVTPTGCAVRAVSFDFEHKIEQPVAFESIREVMAGGRYVWIDVDVHDSELARSAIAALPLAETFIDAALTHDPMCTLSRADSHVHVVVAGASTRAGKLHLDRVDIVLGERCLITVHKGRIPFLDEVNRQYKQDFIRFAKSPGFLVYELWDCLVESYLAVQKQFEERVEAVQAEIIREGSEELFLRVSEVGSDLLHFRKVLLPVRWVLHELATRKSPFIPDSTQPFLANLVGNVEHVLQDVLVDRDILSESLNLYLSSAAHRTNQTMKYLTLLSAVFLPLAFVVGFFGQNFSNFPGMDTWVQSDALMWAMIFICVLTPAAMITLFKLKRWL